MISICIPVYNYNISPLINELSNQIKSLNVQHEIIIIDDGSDNFNIENKNICKEFNYIELPQNIGRAKIRNLFLKYAKYNYLLFLDCDSLIGSANFLSKYVAIINDSPNVVCGGSLYPKIKPSRDKILHWKYGILRESQPLEIRRRLPNKSFTTNNFLINKKILEEIKFDERITQYGHEDTLFGFSLKKANISITHIDNPAVIGDVEQNSEYLKKTKEAIINLINILNFTEYDKDLIDEITLLKFYKKVRKAEKIINFSFVILKPFTFFLLTKGYFNLYLFDYYKLGIFIENIRINPHSEAYKKLNQ
jgi:glycosyltransferase involved in cell wall biosynthesis